MCIDSPDDERRRTPSRIVINITIFLTVLAFATAVLKISPTVAAAGAFTALVVKVALMAGAKVADYSRRRL